MAKDPAFLLYSKDFYEGTRMMLPEERACYMDLMIYQHQNGAIPKDLRRVQMYCSGCSLETIENVLKDKFNETVNGWLNEKLTEVVNERALGKPKKIASASFAGLISSSSNLNKSQIIKIKKKFIINDFIFEENGDLIKDETLIKSRVKEWFKQLVNQMVNNLAIEDANENESKGLRKRGAGEKTEFDLELETLKSEIKNQFSWKESLVKEYRGISPGYNSKQLEEHLQEFFRLIKTDGVESKNLKDFQRHFNRWARLQLKKSHENKSKNEKSKFATNR